MTASVLTASALAARSATVEVTKKLPERSVPAIHVNASQRINKTNSKISCAFQFDMFFK